MRATVTLAITAASFMIGGQANAQTVRSASGANAAAITLARDQFRADLGGGTTAGANGSFGGLRREINWDGVPDAFAAPASLPANFFNANSPRGAVFSTAGSGFQVSARSGNPTGTPIDFADTNFTYSGIFESFSAQRLFTAVGSNVMDVQFFVPGTNTPALVRGFGAVFSDVDLAATTSISFFDTSNILIASFFAPATTGNQTFSFIGASFADPLVARVRIISGNVALGPNTFDTTISDVVVMDDFLYGEPVAIPEPASWALMIGGFGLIGWRARRRTAKRRRCRSLPTSSTITNCSTPTIAIAC